MGDDWDDKRRHHVARRHGSHAHRGGQPVSPSRRQAAIDAGADAVRRLAGPRHARRITFAENEAEPIVGGSVVRAPGAEGGVVRSPGARLAELAVAQGATGGIERREDDGEEPLKEAGERVSEGEGLAVEGVEAVEEAEPAAAAAIHVAAQAARVPYLVQELAAGHYRAAVKYALGGISPRDAAELIKLAIERLPEVGVTLSEEVASKILGWVAAGGVITEALKLGWEWTEKGLEGIRRAHEEGDRDSRIGIYAYAWADTVLTGNHSNPGAVMPEQREAMTLGIRDGAQTRGRYPELPLLLLDEYRDEGNARRALEDALLSRAGIEVRTHRGR
jgi:hypothetical protein